MSTKTADQIRSEFLSFFEEKHHLITDSAPVVPKNDPTLLFTNAGMNPFKAIFLGEEEALEANGKTWNRAANTQRCIRVSGKHNDLEEVGHDTYHHTLFEMLGNWSFGDYFKQEAIAWAWELLVDHWGLDPDRLYATVFEGDESDGLPVDEEAIAFWKSETSIAHDHILTCDKKDNFWEMGDTGPCGPCSEIHIDLRSDDERAKVPGRDLVNKDDPKVMEIWNLVFIQFNRKADGRLNPLPAKHVDTGMGFERLCAVLQGKTSNYDTDVFAPVMNRISEMSGTTYGEDESTDIAIRVIADHLRSVSFAIADGASPSNDGRGYVIRRILRRAVRYGWDNLGFKEPFMYRLVDVLADQFAAVFPVLADQKEYVQNVIKAEENSFLKTLGQGIQLFHQISEGRDVIPGTEAFKLHDTYGFPIDLTQLLAREKGIDVDVAGFEQEMKKQKERARAAGSFKTAGDESELQFVNDHSRDDLSRFEFTGYDSLQETVSVIAIKRSADATYLYLDKSPFYAESGGQVADIGTLQQNGAVLKVLNVQKTPLGFEHKVDQLPGDASLSEAWTATVDRSRRIEIEKHHSATHLLHAALRNHLGTHVTQKGSLVEERRLRFDFSHFEAVNPEQLDAIEEEVNRKVQANIPLQVEWMSIDEARERGAMMLFGEKYGDRVRVVTFDPDYSVELCGGTHVRHTGEIGYFRFVQETSVAAGIRRVEAVTGLHADRHLRREKATLQHLQSVVGSGDPIPEIEKLIEQKKALEKELEAVQKEQAGGALDSILDSGKAVEEITLYTGTVPAADMDTLKQLGYDALNKTGEKSVIVLGSTDDEQGKVFLMAAVTDDLISRGLKAGNLVSVLGKLAGGGGGGQPNLATAGGRFPEKLEQCYSETETWIRSHLS
ncbi:MAG: alanine--tRNA ligase [Balneolaceae bacterium]